jgi:hypothetical protein
MNNSALFAQSAKSNHRGSLWVVVFLALIILLRLLTHPRLEDPHHLVWKSFSPSAIGAVASSSAGKSHAAVTGR